MRHKSISLKRGVAAFLAVVFLGIFSASCTCSKDEIAPEDTGVMQENPADVPNSAIIDEGIAPEDDIGGDYPDGGDVELDPEE